ncbi:MAG: nucleotidyltransferase domain-containing protein [Candidatus Bathyarchaeota archaeon]|nr:nucleotidyltransferase domain-containing protein [Candidatus Bathyarchaeota archaeon]
MTNPPSNLRKRVAEEAACLLYSDIEKEYKQAKEKAARMLNANVLPTNLEIALELDRIAEELEGLGRKERLVQMRKEAMELLMLLKQYKPVLVGSVWRGTITRRSDIDITAYSNHPEEVLKTLETSNFQILQTQWMTVTKRGVKKASFHIHALSPIKENIEIVVRNPEEAEVKEKCEIYGDIVSGLRINELEKVLKENPERKFLPE